MPFTGQITKLRELQIENGKLHFIGCQPTGETKLLALHENELELFMSSTPNLLGMVDLIPKFEIEDLNQPFIFDSQI